MVPLIPICLVPVEFSATIAPYLRISFSTLHPSSLPDLIRKRGSSEPPLGEPVPLAPVSLCLSYDVCKEKL